MLWRRFLPVLTAFATFCGGALAQDQMPASQPASLKPVPNQAINLYNEGVKLLNAQNAVAAGEKFQQAIELAPDFADAHTNNGTALVFQGKYAEAMAELEKSVKLKPNSPPAWATLGTCYQSLGQMQKAIEAYKKYLQLDPNGKEAARTKSVVVTLENEIKRSGGTGDAAAGSLSDYLADATQNGVARWPASRLPITVFIKPGVEVPGFRNEFVEILKQALGDWEAASAGRLKIVYVTSAENAKINCSWTNDPKQMMTSAEGGHAMVIPDSQGILKVNLILLTVPPSNNFKMTNNYARRIALHEVGHALGILGHSKDPNDVMFASIPPADLETALSTRDKGTIVALYSEEGAKVASKPLDMNKMLLSGDPQSNVMRTIKLNAEAAEAMSKQNFVLAVSKLEEARKIDPNNELINQNLGAAYGNMATLYAMTRNFAMSDKYFKLALPLLEHGPNKANYAAMLKNYASVLKMTGRAAEAAGIEAKSQAAAH